MSEQPTGFRAARGVLAGQLTEDDLARCPLCDNRYAGAAAMGRWRALLGAVLAARGVANAWSDHDPDDDDKGNYAIEQAIGHLIESLATLDLRTKEAV